MKTSLIVFCLTTSILTSCGDKNKNNFNNKNILNAQTSNSELIKTIESPKIDFIEGRLHYYKEDKYIELENKDLVENYFIRNKMLKEISDNFKSKNIDFEIEHLNSYSLFSKKDIYKIKDNEDIKVSLNQIYQTYYLYSQDKATSFSKVRAYIGSPQNVLSTFSLSLNQQQSEELIDVNRNQPRSFSSNILEESSINFFIKNLDGIDLHIDNFEISNHKKTTFRQEVDLLLRDHYRLVVSSKDSTKYFYINPKYSFQDALSEILKHNIVTDKDGHILTYRGKTNNYQSFFKDKIKLDSTFVKLINFQSQSLNEKPVAGKSYAVVYFDLKEIMAYSKQKTIKDEIYRFNGFQKIVAKIKKDNISNLVIATNLKERVYDIKTKEIKAFYHDKSARSLISAFKPCTLKWGDLYLKEDYKGVNDYNIEIKNEDSFNAINSYLNDNSRVYEIFTEENEIEIIPSYFTTSIEYGHYSHDCKSDKIFDLKTKKEIQLKKMKAPMYEYILNVQTTEQILDF